MRPQGFRWGIRSCRALRSPASRTFRSAGFTLGTALRSAAPGFRATFASGDDSTPAAAAGAGGLNATAAAAAHPAAAEAHPAPAEVPIPILRASS